MIITKLHVEAEIYNLSASLLMGKSSKDEIKRITDLAIEHGLESLLKQEFEDVGKSLLG